MDALALSQKHKITLLLIILSLGFISLGVFTSTRLGSLDAQYQSSSEVNHGVVSIYQTQTELISLASQMSQLTAQQVPSTRQALTTLLEKVEENLAFLNQIGLSDNAEQVKRTAGSFEQALLPWLNLKTELGFSVDDGKLGTLKTLATTIENKIAETGMVTLNSDFQAMIKAQQNYLLQPNEDNLKRFNRAVAGFENMSNTYAMLELYEQEIEQFKATFVQVSELSQQLGDIETQLVRSEQAFVGVIETVTSQLSRISDDYQTQALASSSSTKWSVLIACAVLALLIFAMFLSISVSMTRSLSHITLAIKAIAQGDLSQRLTETNNRNDEFNQLATAINQSCQNLGELVQGVQQSSQALSGDAAKLNLELDNLATSQTEVLGQTQQLASATEEVSVTTQEVSNSLEFVAEISQSSTQAAEQGATVIGAAINSIEEIGVILNSAAGHIQQLEEASTKIDSVMDIINDIAEQTNLLALNAAIEAARAGEQGRGFAVVADEVRSLAVRTVDAVSEISETIETLKKESAEVIHYIGQSESSMNQGRERGSQAMSALSHITTKAEETAHQTDVIFASIKELATTSQSMADSMTQISSAMEALGRNNDHLRDTSQAVDQRSSSLNSDCQRFTV